MTLELYTVEVFVYECPTCDDVSETIMRPCPFCNGRLVTRSVGGIKINITLP